jgi:hypothetical protein
VASSFWRCCSVRIGTVGLSSMDRPARIGVMAIVVIAVVVFTLQSGGASPKAGAADAVPFAPDACRLLSATKVSHLLRLPVSSQTFTDLGFPVSRNTAPNPTYSQCRFASESSRNRISLIVNASLAKAPPLTLQAIAARGQTGARVLTIDRTLAVWMPWTQHDLRGHGGELSSVKHGDYIAVVLIYVHRDPLRVAEDAMRIVLPRI